MLQHVFTYGKKSDDNLMLQQRLIALGKLPPLDLVGRPNDDGIFGNTTAIALGKFLGATGPVTVVDQTAFNKLFPERASTRTYPMDSVLTNIKSAWLSKLNWTLAVHALFNLLMFFGHPVPTDVQSQVELVGNGVFIIGEWVIRTWFTTAITTAAAKTAGLIAK